MEVEEGQIMERDIYVRFLHFFFLFFLSPTFRQAARRFRWNRTWKEGNPKRSKATVPTTMLLTAATSCNHFLFLSAIFSSSCGETIYFSQNLAGRIGVAMRHFFFVVVRIWTRKKQGREKEYLHKAEKGVCVSE